MSNTCDRDSFSSYMCISQCIREFLHTLYFKICLVLQWANVEANTWSGSCAIKEMNYAKRYPAVYIIFNIYLTLWKQNKWFGIRCLNKLMFFPLFGFIILFVSDVTPHRSLTISRNYLNKLYEWISLRQLISFSPTLKLQSQYGAVCTSTVMYRFLDVSFFLFFAQKLPHMWGVTSPTEDWELKNNDNFYDVIVYNCL